jgi:hypothetical protein
MIDKSKKLHNTTSIDPLILINLAFLLGDEEIVKGEIKSRDKLAMFDTGYSEMLRLHEIDNLKADGQPYHTIELKTRHIIVSKESLDLSFHSAELTHRFIELHQIRNDKAATIREAIYFDLMTIAAVVWLYQVESGENVYDPNDYLDDLNVSFYAAGDDFKEAVNDTQNGYLSWLTAEAIHRFKNYIV